MPCREPSPKHLTRAVVARQEAIDAEESIWADRGGHGRGCRKTRGEGGEVAKLKARLDEQVTDIARRLQEQQRAKDATPDRAGAANGGSESGRNRGRS